ncbi:BppU family phage baseplate upper protein [Limosilactobacillus vaginalis]|uniref:BppU family phage baseplate upper protein n=1 Tax=Limosilactobacillus vaginalis TaxID=1633 RepID=UPI0025A4C04B|nr:BppU family phage baseplate upper protein [Limosilactobacillus vaginalis]MDM8244210.1 BppU family phage baseplate upper protein [Limosilactobacillus vaginalis]
MPVEIGQKQLKDAKDGIIHVTHNNGRVIYTIAIDIAKEGTEIWDLTPYFKARVNDSNAQLKVTWYQQGELLNLEGKKPYIEGNVGDYYVDDQKQIQLDGNAQPVSYNGDPIDFGEGGRATYRFPDEMFPKQGIFKGYIGVADDKGRVSGVTIWFKVLPGLARMGHAKEVYVSEIEDMKLQFAAQQRASINDAKQKLEDTVQSMNADYQKALDEHNKNFDAEMADIKSKLDEANQLAQGILDSDELLDKALDANTEAIQNAMAPVLNQSNVFQAQNTFKQGAVMQNGLTVNGPLLVNGVDLSKLADQVNTLQVSVNKITGGK